MEIVYLIVGLLVGAGAVYLFFKGKNSGIDPETVSQLREEKSKFEERNNQLGTQLDEAKTALSASQQSTSDLNTQLATREQELKNMHQRLEEHKAEVSQLQERFTTEFKNIANEILEDKSKKFTEQNKVNIGEILNPLNEKIKDFEKKVDESHKQSIMQNAGLKEQLKMLQGLNQQMSDEAKNLTRALKGENKAQGNWGEVILERILEKSGLVKDREYKTQESFNADNGKRYQPDVVVYLPEGKTVVIDSKVSLVDYEKYSSAETDAEREIHLKSHIRSIRAHIKGLGEKEYQNIYELSGLDFVLLFVPIEPAFNLAAQHDNDLYTEALDKNIVIVSTSTLLATLRTIASIWRQEYQNKNALEIARQSGALYDKFVSFTEDLIDIGKRIDTTKQSYVGAMNKLVEGNGNLVSRVERLKKLGANASKNLSQPLLDKAGVELSAGQQQIELPDEN